ncbi:hypothetical protein DACRYDRAFT_20854 [Dacryopinax primogenitus]|uniref:Mitochondrial import inner membrane translocase subunit TIM16 n=1 Tax=Dacryopinax primogenitus (strain DJM 731) TaxID=1858805 RepID=M5G6F4_DACPD|nr:uncharacterized protein DACRYDRAFT_20854 [Dacryopinax primogenitus]EJU04274.1 hypothetical protein DACRYDRAFT_20854 [Dacryopinax primogenitus]
MSLPRAIIQIVITGSGILGKAFYEAGRQAMKNAQYRPASILGNEVAGVAGANTGSATDVLTRQHRMTLDEAHLILNTKKGDVMPSVLQKYEHLFKVNAPPAPPEAGKPHPKVPPPYSHYLQSKVVRAKERIEAELNAPKDAPGGPAPPGSSSPASAGPTAAGEAPPPGASS